ncbi:EAL domain-containing protein [Pseudomonas sp. p1(2021b)]|uniref:EAL domain-containing protein n=1 Tax=Pseudomonas sp. p1(2021b) TaxID=2874628 RepID=UPI001CCA10C9|nr:EAL domain-containing protein [Pseudomonas sp. p1(2021b)]UBM24160.1 EAL domain-containing protein [Pseudomonas sp. p1(2021b)]
MKLLSQGNKAKSHHPDVALFYYFSILNIRHIKVAYGLNEGLALLPALLSRLQSYGIQNKALSYASKDTILVSLKDDHKLNPTLILADLHKTPLVIKETEIIPTLACGLVTQDDLELLSTPEIGEFSASHKIVKNVIRRGKWRERYIKDMERAVGLFKSIDKLQLRYQPVYPTKNLAQGNELYWESLSTHKDQGGIQKTLSSLERLCLTNYFDHHNLLKTIATLNNDPTIRLGCNISPSSLCDDLWWQSIYSELEDSPSVSSRLVIEVTEEYEISSADYPIATEIIKKLKSLGCIIALDDFGKSSSGFRNLAALDPEIIKIDMSYLHGARHSLESIGKLKALIDFCKSSNMLCVLEGVETEADLSVAREFQADLVQGYYFHKLPINGSTKRPFQQRYDPPISD